MLLVAPALSLFRSTRRVVRGQLARARGRSTRRGAWRRTSFPWRSALTEPKCLQGYILCKLTFAFVSVLFAGEDPGHVGRPRRRAAQAPSSTAASPATGSSPRGTSRGDAKPTSLPEPRPPAEAARARRAAASSRRPADLRAGVAAPQLFSSFADLIVTGSVGTFWCMPLDAVCDLLDLLHHVHALDHLAEHRVADAVLAPCPCSGSRCS